MRKGLFCARQSNPHRLLRRYRESDHFEDEEKLHVMLVGGVSSDLDEVPTGAGRARSCFPPESAVVGTDRSKRDCVRLLVAVCLFTQPWQC